jgi:hypothetical protein
MSADTFGDKLFALHWVPSEDRWETITWATWMTFRGLSAEFVPLPNVRGGVHHFVVCAHDSRVPLNLIPHKYLIDPDGRIGNDNFAGLTREERTEYQRLMIAMEHAPGDQEQIEAIRAKMDISDPPPDSYDALVRALPNLPRRGSAAADPLHKFRYGIVRR